MVVPLGQIPRPNLTQDVILESAQMRLLVQSASSNSLLTANYCPTNNWTAVGITWEKRPCNQKNSLIGVDSIIINNSSLPNVSALDVLGGIKNAIHDGSSKITFAITSFPLSTRPQYYPSPEFVSTAGYVTFWSTEKAGYGFSAAPTLVISYTVKDSLFSTSLAYMLSTVLPTLAIIIPALLWIYRRTKKHRKSDISNSLTSNRK
jgi:hypothetical protein